MIKKLIGCLLLCNFLTAHEEVFYTDEDDELFNRGKFVGEENQDYIRARKRERNTNWAITLGTTAIGIATVILVGKNHTPKED